MQQQELEYVIVRGGWFVPPPKGEHAPLKRLGKGARIKLRPDLAARFPESLKPANVFEAEQIANTEAQKAREAAMAAHLKATQGPIAEPDVADGTFAKESAKRGR